MFTTIIRELPSDRRGSKNSCVVLQRIKMMQLKIQRQQVETFSALWRERPVKDWEGEDNAILCCSFWH